MSTEFSSDLDTRPDTYLDDDVRTDVRTMEELLDAVAHGDEHAFGLLYDRLVAPVMGLVHAVVRDRTRSEQVVRDVFVELWRTAARYRPERGTARAWAMTVAHHLAVDRVRTARTPVDRKRDGFVRDYPGSDHGDLVEEVLESLDRRQVREGLRALTDLERESILLAYYRALTYHEVAENLHVGTGTVTNRMRAGLRELRDHLTRGA